MFEKKRIRNKIINPMIFICPKDNNKKKGEKLP